MCALVRTLELCTIVVLDNRSSGTVPSIATLCTESFMSGTDRTVAEDEFDESLFEAFPIAATSTRLVEVCRKETMCRTMSLNPWPCKFRNRSSPFQRHCSKSQGSPREDTSDCQQIPSFSCSSRNFSSRRSNYRSCSSALIIHSSRQVPLARLSCSRFSSQLCESLRSRASDSSSPWASAGRPS